MSWYCRHSKMPKGRCQSCGKGWADVILDLKSQHKQDKKKWLARIGKISAAWNKVEDELTAEMNRSYKLKKELKLASNQKPTTRNIRPSRRIGLR